MTKIQSIKQFVDSCYSYGTLKELPEWKRERLFKYLLIVKQEWNSLYDRCVYVDKDNVLVSSPDFGPELDYLNELETRIMRTLGILG